VTLNCGYGRGYSVREVLDAVERNHGRKFPVNVSGRRPGDIVVSVAAANRIRRTLDWIPEFESLDTIVRHALAWEHKLMARDAAVRREAASG
jgi:UDP-glucose 4-epimerase